jgi:hypothetical protein
VPGTPVSTVRVTGQAGVEVPPGLQELTPLTNVGAVKLEGFVTAVNAILSLLRLGQPFSGVAVMLTRLPVVAIEGAVTLVTLEPTATHGILQVATQALLLNRVLVTTVSGIGTVVGGLVTLTQ